MGELTHRVRNSLAIVQALARQTGRRATSVSEFLQDFGGRIEAMSSAHNLLSEAQWHGVEVRALIESQTIALFGSDRAVSIRGAGYPQRADGDATGADTARAGDERRKIRRFERHCGRLEFPGKMFEANPARWRSSGRSPAVPECPRRSRKASDCR